MDNHLLQASGNLYYKSSGKWTKYAAHLQQTNKVTAITLQDITTNEPAVGIGTSLCQIGV